MKSDAELLLEYAREHSDDSFRELVSRYTDLAYSAALRETNNDPHLAKDITQAVFVSVARKAAALAKHTSIAGWIYTTVRYEARNLHRANQRRITREQEAYTMNQLLSTSDEHVDWARLLPVLDDGMHSLNEADRHAIVLRFFERRRFADVAQILGLSEDAARKRIARAIDRLRSALARTGLPLSAVSLAEALEAHAVSAAPLGVAAGISSAAIALAPNASTSLPIFKAIMLTKTKIIGAVILAAVSGAFVLQQREARQLRTENKTLRSQLIQSESSAEQAPPPSSLDANKLDPAEHRELLRLRGEVGLLRKQLAAARPPATAAPPSSQDKPDQQDSMRRMNEAQALLLGLYNYAGQNGGQVPTNFTQAAEFVTVALKNQPRNSEASASGSPADLYQALTNRFEIVYRGKLDDAPAPAATIVLREKEAWQAPDGSWNRTYSFADGHTELHRAPDGNFEPWEQAHTQQLPPSDPK